MSDREQAIRDVDPSGQLADVRGLPDHLRDALWRVDSAQIAPGDVPGGVVVCGMGGSAIGGDLAAAVFGDRLSRPLHTVRGYSLPSWTPDDALIVFCSYSGNTEETISCYDQAAVRGLQRVVATTGGALGERARRDGVPVVPFPAGLQPRAAVGYTFGTAAMLTHLAGGAPSPADEIEGAAGFLEAEMDALSSGAAELEERLEGSVPVVYGAGLTAPVAYRWKTQINEYGKVPAFTHVLPELDHNEIVGWQGAVEALGPHSAIFLTDRDQHPRERRRAELTEQLIVDTAHTVAVIETEGDTRTDRLLWALVLGDLLSLYIAGRRGIDPAPVAVIESLKDQLGRPE